MGRSLQFLVVLLGLSHLISLNAIPLTRTQSLFREPQEPMALGNPQQTITEEAWEEEFSNGRMDLESNDYSGSGPNNRHIPKPPGGKM